MLSSKASFWKYKKPQQVRNFGKQFVQQTPFKKPNKPTNQQKTPIKTRKTLLLMTRIRHFQVSLLHAVGHYTAPLLLKRTEDFHRRKTLERKKRLEQNRKLSASTYLQQPFVETHNSSDLRTWIEKQSPRQPR